MDHDFIIYCLLYIIKLSYQLGLDHTQEWL